mmetsp:Transcript_46739/g.133308  ORF Transcript_46739/g.133308 Transcript_46739/m.133308 type:complete len:243 (-) Transcript_46739:93-821(-)
MAGGRGVRLFVFDFDQTLSVHHVFKTLAGWGDGDDERSSDQRSFRVPAPFATSEEGQVLRIEELNKSTFQKVGGFALAAFGGETRVNEVRALLDGLSAHGAELFVCTKGLIGAVKKCLHDLKLLQYFKEVYGNAGASYGLSAYDRAAEAALSAASRALLGRPEQANWGTKDKLIVDLMRSSGLRQDQCVLVEDDPEEIRRAQPVCRTLLVKDAAGMTQAQMAQLLAMAAEPRARGRSGCLVQ